MSVDTAVYLRIIGYVIALSVPLFLFFANGANKQAIAVKYILSTIVMYHFIAAPLFNLNYQLDRIVLSLDRDGDGAIVPGESATWTKEDTRADHMWAADGARNVFGYLISPVFAAAYTFIVFLLLYASHWLVAALGKRPRSHGMTLFCFETLKSICSGEANEANEADEPHVTNTPDQPSL